MKKSFRDSVCDAVQVIITFFIAVFFIWSAGTCSPLVLAIIIAGVLVALLYDNFNR